MIKKISVLFIISLFSIYLLPSIGCIDNSLHLQDFPNKPDYKTYHFVKCDCPCIEHRLIEKRGKCMRCGHYHNPKYLATFKNTEIDIYPPKVENIYTLFQTMKLIETNW